MSFTAPRRADSPLTPLSDAATRTAQSRTTCQQPLRRKLTKTWTQPARGKAVCKTTQPKLASTCMWNHFIPPMSANPLKAPNCQFAWMRAEGGTFSVQLSTMSTFTWHITQWLVPRDLDRIKKKLNEWHIPRTKKLPYGGYLYLNLRNRITILMPPPQFPWWWLPLKEQLLIPDLIGHLEIIAKMNYGNMKQWQTVLFRPTKSAGGNDWNRL